MNMQKLLRQAQEMQEKMQRELADTEVEASVGGGVVTVRMNGHKHLVSVKIDPEVIDPEDPAMLEDLIRAANNQAVVKVDEALKSRLGAVASNLPGIF